ncbi:type VI secretion system Vgr family protein [Burkholderia metallica]|uniref:type VI secretion system Vgr family protein n=1 Tax=Burkholderia metallica TaxID=488729 RepID=UPI000A0155AE|nr:type VI secretion system Vgr family protein [Burkholderia metallica]
MADLLERVERYGANHEAVTGRQAYFLDVAGSASGRELSVVSFTATERIGDPYRIVIELTHPDSLLRGDYLGRDATFTIAPEDGTRSRVFAGCVTHFAKTKTTKDFSLYRLVVEAHTARLRLARTSRIYQQRSAPQIIEAILRRHGFKGHQFAFALRRQYPQHAFRFQYQMSDLAYIGMLMQKEGIYSYFTQGKHGDVLVFADDVDHYVYAPELNARYRETAGLEAGVEAVFALEMHAKTVPQSILVADYNPDQAWERFKADANVAKKDVTTYGQAYVYGTHHLDQEGARWEAQLRHEAEIAWQVIYEGESNVLELRPARVLRVDEALPDAPTGQVVVETVHTGGRGRAYRNTYQAIPADRRIRLRLDEAAWPKINGTLSARVTSPGDYDYAYLTQQGRYTVRFDLDFDEWNPGGESVPLRLAKPFAGSLQTGFHFPALHGDEAVVAFRDGDPDKPYLSQFHHHSQAVDLVTNQDRWLSRNVIRTQSNNKLRMEDWRGCEGIKLSTEHSGKSQLNLGYLVDSNKQRRGEGFELRTSGYGAIRAGKGLFVTTDDRPKAAGDQLDMQEALARLNDAQARMEGLAQAAAVAQADAADARSMQQVLQDQIRDLRQAVMLLSSNASITTVTPDTLIHSAGANLTMTAGANADIGVLRKFTVAAGEAVSLFAQKMGIKLFAARGKVRLQAQRDEMELTSQQNLTVTSSDGHVIVQAGKSIMLTDGGGAYIKLDNGNVTIASPNKVTIRMADFAWDGPDSAAGKLPAFAVCAGSKAAASIAGENSMALS